ncbi:bromodomain adjacent to zinc finger domain protein 1A [Anopheles ziemanni]|uniref:bromodomain adjacent to zinc finger domain protein 1A n=1 Tax=Anopheles ziemanni TaxID=345580 RepID=UPI00265FBDB5|nr:bromodomain adjacent to zinc finger domain protein 1A [Anopheles ziemanni]
MPLFRRQPFQKVTSGERLRDDEKVFYCEATGEIFTNYEDFFHRMMLISSMLWSCALTGKPNLTYLEALASEKAARKMLKTFPDAVKGPFLLVATHTKRTAINEMHDDVYSFIKDQLFKGEEVEALDPVSKHFRRARIMKVEPGEGWPNQQKPSNLMYHVMGKDYATPKVWIVPGPMLKRDRHTLTRDKCKIFLKQHIETGPGGLLRIKQESLDRYVRGEGLTDEQVFFGHVPDFELSKKLKREEAKREERSKAKANGETKRNEAATLTGSDGGGIVRPPEKKKRQQKKGKDKTAVAQEGDSGGKDPKQSMKQLQASIESFVERSQDDLERIAKMKEEEMLRMKQKAEQEAAAKKRQEERKALLAKLVTLAMKKYNTVFDDQTLEDQRVIPPVRPVRTLIPAKYFGNFVFILEFLNSFSDLLSSRSKFPNGFTMDLLERALLLREVNGPLSDIFQVLLSAIFTQQAEEENEVDVRYKRPENIALKRQTVPDQVRARDTAIWVQKHYCSKVHELPLDSTTVSEVLRLHLLASGALVEEKAAKHRYYNRGGFVNSDDPGLRLVQDYPHILRALKSYPVYQLPIGDVIQLLCCLIHQLLTYSGVRELVEERVERARVARINYQANRAAQRRVTNKVGSAKNVARENLKKELAAYEGGDGPEKDAARIEMAARLDAELNKIEVDAERQLKELTAKAKKLKEDFFDYQIYLGTDRCYRSYWLYESLPGLFVEHDRTAVGQCAEQPTINNADLAKCPNEMRRKYITRSIMTAGMSASFMERFTAGSLPDEAILYDQLLAEGSADLPAHEKQALLIERQPVPLENGGGDGGDEVIQLDPVIPTAPPQPTNQELLMCTAIPDSCPVHADREGPSWGYYASAEELDALIHSLNVRGLREKQLRETLECERDLIATHIANCPAAKLSITADASREQLLAVIVSRQQRKYDSPNFSYDPGTEPNEIMEAVLVENLLELEAKITVGYLGVMRVRDRQKWRDAIEARSYDAQTDEPLVWGPKWLAKLGCHQNGGEQQEQEQVKQEQQEDKDDELGSDDESEMDDVERLLSHAKEPGYNLPDTTVSLMDDSTVDDESDALVYPLHESETLQRRVYELASALLQIEQCIEQKFLRHPFGPKKEHKDRNLMQQKQLQGLKNRIKWEVSLMRSSCFAQLFLHYAVLYDAIHWSRSAERISCMICRRKGDPDLTLLCDECNRACHIYCLKPKLKQVPAGDWYCVRCRPEQHQVKKPAAANKKKKIFKWEDDDDDDEEDVEEEEEEEDNEVQEEDEQEEEEEAEDQDADDDGEEDASSLRADDEPVENGEHDGGSESEDEEVSDDDDDDKDDEEYGPRKKAKLSKTAPSAGGSKVSKGGPAAKGTSSTRRASRYQDRTEVSDEDGENESDDDAGGSAINDSDEYMENGRGTVSRGGGAKRKKTQENSPPENGRPNAKNPRRTAPKRQQQPLTNGKPSKGSPRLTASSENAGSESETSPGQLLRVSARSTKGRRRSSLSNGALNGDEANESAGAPGHRAPRRSRRTGDEVPLNSVVLYTLIDDILKHPDSWPFNRPVSAKEVPDYYKVIKNPMDFARVKSKLNMGDYKINEQMLADVQLVFRNCDLYNTDETDVFTVGRNLERYVVKRCKELSLPFTPSDMQKFTVEQNGPTGRAADAEATNSGSDDDDDDDDDE